MKVLMKNHTVTYHKTNIETPSQKFTQMKVYCEMKDKNDLGDLYILNRFWVNATVVDIVQT